MRLFYMTTYREEIVSCLVCFTALYGTARSGGKW